MKKKRVNASVTDELLFSPRVTPEEGPDQHRTEPLWSSCHYTKIFHADDKVREKEKRARETVW